MDPQEVSGSPNNDEVARLFRAYEDSDKGCSPVNNGRRVILTGFGLWSNASINYSGFVLDNLTSLEFWPATNHAPASQFPPNYRFKTGVLKKSEDVRIINRPFQLDSGQNISACIIITDVLWDFAGAIIANEMTRFQPDAVIMTGVSSEAYLEAGALKIAEFVSGYYPDGTPDLNNIPDNRWILQNPSSPLTLPMTWDNRKLSRLIRPLLAKMGVRLSVPEAARSNNYYICNNTSYLALAAAKNLPLYLAGDRIAIKPEVHSNPKVGFFHFPNVSSTDAKMLQSYAQVLMTIVEGSLD